MKTTSKEVAAEILATANDINHYLRAIDVPMECYPKDIDFKLMSMRSRIEAILNPPPAPVKAPAKAQIEDYLNSAIISLNEAKTRVEQLFAAGETIPEWATQAARDMDDVADSIISNL